MLRALLAVAIAVVIGSAAVVLHAADEAGAPGGGHGYLIDKHIAAHLSCSACHSENPPAATPETAKCLTCHGGSYGRLAADTVNDQPNPHQSHQGELACSSCHHVHKASVTMCSSCHSFDMITP